MNNDVSFVDTHCHIGKSFYKDFLETEPPDPEVLVKEANEAGVKTLINVGASLASSIEACEDADRFDGVYSTLGVYPDNIGEVSVEKLTKEFEGLLKKHKKIVAIGEIGLDYTSKTIDEEKKEQMVYFEALLDWAGKLEPKLPLTIHCRDAWKDVENLVANAAKSANGGKYNGVFHCFTGTYEDAKWCVDHGFVLGIGGIITFKNGEGLRQVVKKIGIEHIVLETDCPWLAPEPYRGQVNYPKYIPVIAKKVAEVLDIDVEEGKRGVNLTSKRLKFTAD